MRRGLSLASSRTKHETVWDDARACSRRNPGRRSPHARLDTDSRSTFTLPASCCLQIGTKTACLYTHCTSPRSSPLPGPTHGTSDESRGDVSDPLISSPCFERPVENLPTELAGHCFVYAQSHQSVPLPHGKIRRWHDDEIHLRLSRTCHRHLRSLWWALASLRLSRTYFAISHSSLHALFASPSDGSLPLTLRTRTSLLGPAESHCR
jgi:hypothetical protein